VGFDFPFEVDVEIDDNIGGPSAGLMMSLAIYDTLTPGPLTGGDAVAGTGTITPSGEVGPIGGIQQKVAAARDAGADLFFVPADNCDSIGGVDTGDMRLARATTLDQAVETITDWVADPDTTLPSCEDVPS
jgi:PDZ domain-containing protein